jgi:hypothetical protein
MVVAQNRSNTYIVTPKRVASVGAIDWYSSAMPLALLAVLQVERPAQAKGLLPGSPLLTLVSKPDHL